MRIITEGERLLNAEISKFVKHRNKYPLLANNFIKSKLSRVL